MGQRPGDNNMVSALHTYRTRLIHYSVLASEIQHHEEDKERENHNVHTISKNTSYHHRRDRHYLHLALASACLASSPSSFSIRFSSRSSSLNHLIFPERFEETRKRCVVDLLVDTTDAPEAPR